jgi:hypothetical protein
MNLSLTLFSTLSFFTFLFNGGGEDSLKTSIYFKTIEINKECDNEVFQLSLDAYNEFYKNKYKNVKLKVGKLSFIEQEISKVSDNQKIELVYNEVLQLKNNKISLAVELEEVYSYSIQKSRRVRLTPSEIKESSRKGIRVRELQKQIRDKSESLLSHIVAKVSG